MLKRTPLYDVHRDLGARMVEFAGWEMPVQYSSILQEHHAVRNAAGLFDISHMGRFLVIGPDTLPFLQKVATCDVARIDVGMSHYGLLCNSYGGIVDDVFIYNLPNAYMVVVNASNRQKDWNWLLKHAANCNVRMVDYSDQWAMLALQGPLAESIMMRMHADQAATIAAIPFHGVIKGRFFGVDECLVARTGYTGEDGFEIYVTETQVTAVWNALLDAGKADGLLPCGLGARDSLRFEPCMSLYGHEIGDDINPYEARLGWVIDLAKGAFTGQDALAYMKKHGASRRLVGFEMVGKGVARQGYPIQDTAGKTIGHVTTGMPSPTLGKPLGMGFVPTELSKVGSEFAVVIREKPIRARVVKMPFYQPRYKK